MELDFMCFTTINPATSWFEIVELSSTEVEVLHKGKVTVDMIIDKSAVCKVRFYLLNHG